jgi:aldehyde dehydrogenase (NAD+)
VSESLETIKNRALQVFRNQQANRRRIKATSAGERIEKLNRLQKALDRRFDELKQAVCADLRKPESEVRLMELYPLISEIKHVRRMLGQWMRPVSVPAPLAFFGSRSQIYTEPKGVILILCPWNFPFLLSIGPLVSAIAAGNCAMVKPSELSPHTSRFVGELVSDLFDENEVAVFEGDHQLAQFLVEQPFDHIFFTGSPRVGRDVMARAAANLTSVTLELGGKSPVLIDPTADLREAATKIAWGKSVNAGQSCVAPDYVLVPEALEERFLQLLKKGLQKRYGKLDGIGSNPDYCRIINARHFERLSGLVHSAVGDGARVVCGASFREEDRFVSPTVLTGVNPESPLLQEEIFGPVLPVVPYRTRDEALQFINARPRPLALYIFARNPSAVEDLLQETSAGDTVVNDVVVHFANARLPFGGFNQSGIGKAHGEAGFRAFSHQRAVMRQPKRTLTQLLYPPYTALVDWLIRFTVKYL